MPGCQNGDRPGRPLELGQAVGAFLRQLVQGEVDAPFLDDFALRNLQAYVQEQAEATGAVPTDRQVVVECFRDELGDWRVCVLSPLGSRVHAPWGLALEALYSASGAYDVHALWTDDGICLRFADVEELPALDERVRPLEPTTALEAEVRDAAEVDAGHATRRASTGTRSSAARGTRRTFLRSSCRAAQPCSRSESGSLS